MSKNYTKYSKRQETAEPIKEPVANEGVIEKPTIGEQVIEEKKTFEEPVMEELIPPPAKLTGTVINCKNLNVRRTPNVQVNNVVTTIPNSAIVTIESETHGFYEISTEAGVKGYCMKKYIDVN